MLETADDGSGIRIGFTAPVFLSHFYGPPTLERLDFLFEHERRWVDARPHFCAISVLDPRIGMEMSAPARARAKEITEFWGPRMIASVTVVEGNGFFPAMVRSVIAGIQLLSARSAVKLHVAGDIPAAVDLASATASRHQITVDVAAITAAIEELVAPNRPRRKSA